MMNQGQSLELEAAEVPPLTIPNDVWQGVSPDEKLVLRRAQRILDHLVLSERMTLPEMRDKTGFDIEELLTSLRALAGMRLVTFDSEAGNLVAELIAVPDE